MPWVIESGYSGWHRSREPPAMPRKRLPQNQGLPPRWVIHHGAYYFLVPKGLEQRWDGKAKFLLGHTIPEAHRVFADRMAAAEAELVAQVTGVITVGKLLDRYMLEVIPTKRPSTQATNQREMILLRAAFGATPIDKLRPKHIYEYASRRVAKVRGRREIALLSHVFTKAVEWGIMDRHPFKGEIRLARPAPRDRYIEDWEIVECLNLAPAEGRKRGSVRAIQAYIRVKLLTGMARGDLLRLTEVDLREDGIHNQRHKTRGSTGKRTIYTWTPELREAIGMAKVARPKDIARWLFCTRDGECYINERTGDASGWDSMWQRFMRRVLTETKVTQSFTEHDLRAKCASDAETLEQARALLAHADAGITARVYRRRAERVEPGRAAWRKEQ